MKSGTTSTPFLCSASSASAVHGILAPWGIEAGLQAGDIVSAHDIRPRGRNPDVTGHVEDGVDVTLLAVGMIVQRTARILQRDQRTDIEAIAVGQRAAGVACGDKNGALLGEKTRRMFAHRAETLHGDARTF